MFDSQTQKASVFICIYSYRRSQAKFCLQSVGNNNTSILHLKILHLKIHKGIRKLLCL